MERPVYVREMSDGLYSPLTYLLYKVCRRTSTAPALQPSTCKAQHVLSVATPRLTCLPRSRKGTDSC